MKEQTNPQDNSQQNNEQEQVKNGSDAIGNSGTANGTYSDEYDSYSSWG